MKDGDDHNHSVRHIRWLLLCALPAWPDSLHFRYINKAPLSGTNNTKQSNNSNNNNDNSKEDNKNGAHAALCKQKLVLHPNKDNNKTGQERHNDNNGHYVTESRQKGSQLAQLSCSPAISFSL